MNSSPDSYLLAPSSSKRKIEGLLLLCTGREPRLSPLAKLAICLYFQPGGSGKWGQDLPTRAMLGGCTFLQRGGEGRGEERGARAVGQSCSPEPRTQSRSKGLAHPEPWSCRGSLIISPGFISRCSAPSNQATRVFSVPVTGDLWQPQKREFIRSCLIIGRSQLQSRPLPKRDDEQIRNDRP